MPTSLQGWETNDASLFAAVSSFGLSGTNAHVVLEEAPPAPAPVQATPADAPSLLALSTRTPEALRALAGRYADLLAGPDAPALADVAAAAGAGRSHFAQRAALVGTRPPDVLAALTALAEGKAHPALHSGAVPVGAPAPRVVFVCAGQGGQWPGMVAALRGDPVAAAALEGVAAAAPADLGWSLAALLADPSAPWLERIDQLQPILFAVQVALAARLKAWGIIPAAVVGHSFGEVAAAYLAGALSLPDALRVICARSRVLGRIGGQGAMAVVELAEPAVQTALKEYDGAVSVAGVNGPRSVLVSGAVGAVDALVAGWGAAGVWARRLAVGAAAHSPQLDGMLPGLGRELAGLTPQSGEVPFYSTVTGQLQDGVGLDGGYWARNLGSPVAFWGAVQALAADGHTHFVELGPHPTLASALGDGLRALGVDGQALAAMRRDQPWGETLLGAVGALYCTGTPVTWPPTGAARYVAHRLPTYPFQRERYWIDAARPAAGDEGDRLPADAHPLLGRQQALATETGKYFWTRTLSVASLPELVDHQVDGLVVLPGAAYLEMLLAAGAACNAGQSLSGVAFSQALALPADGSLEVQTVLTQHGQGATVEVLSRAPGEAGPWTRHARGIVQVAEGAPPAGLAVAELQARCA
ncbi:MAG TPA: type I polyketide synthase, partial [bacterium]